jgi:hypothetical protein
MQASPRLSIPVLAWLQQHARYAFLAVIVTYVTIFAALVAWNDWPRDGIGIARPLDFVNVYAAGTLAHEHRAAKAYERSTQEPEESVVLHRPFTHDYYFGWHYPPPFLIVAFGLASLSYIVALFGWIFSTLLFFLAALRQIVRKSVAILAGIAFPSSFFNVLLGQNGFFSAALLGTSLTNLETKPVVSGLFLGLMIYKPQLAMLFPFALIAGGHWRALFSAAVTATAVSLLTIAIFGWQIWVAFFHSIPVSTDLLLIQGLVGFEKIDSIFSVVRWAGGGLNVATAVQGIVTALVAAFTVAHWRSNRNQSQKSAALLTASLLATPYLYVYDLQILAVAIAFFVRERLPDFVEFTGLAVICVVLLAGSLMSLPSGFFAVALMAGLVARRVFASNSQPAAACESVAT